MHLIELLACTSFSESKEKECLNVLKEILQYPSRLHEMNHFAYIPGVTQIEGPLIHSFIASNYVRCFEYLLSNKKTAIPGNQYQVDSSGQYIYASVGQDRVLVPVTDRVIVNVYSVNSIGLNALEYAAYLGRYSLFIKLFDFASMLGSMQLNSYLKNCGLSNNHALFNSVLRPLLANNTFYAMCINEKKVDKGIFTNDLGRRLHILDFLFEKLSRSGLSVSLSFECIELLKQLAKLDELRREYNINSDIKIGESDYFGGDGFNNVLDKLFNFKEVYVPDLVSGSPNEPTAEARIRYPLTVEDSDLFVKSKPLSVLFQFGRSMCSHNLERAVQPEKSFFVKGVELNKRIEKAVKLLRHIR